MGNQTSIEKAFYTTFAALGYPYVSYPAGPKVVPPATSVNYALSVLYGDGASVTIGADGERRFDGLFQVTIRCPEDGGGTYVATEAAEAIIAAFPRASALQYPSLPAAADAVVHLRDPAVRHFGNITPEWYTIVVRIPFRTEI